MHYFRTKKSIFAWISLLLMFFIQIAPLQAAMLDNKSLMSEISRTNLVESLDRAEIQDLLVSMGVDKEAATIRIQQMNDNELASLQQRFQQLPAGAGAFGTLALIFLVLVITDSIGATDIFPFIKKVE